MNEYLLYVVYYGRRSFTTAPFRLFFVRWLSVG